MNSHFCRFAEMVCANERNDFQVFDRLRAESPEVFNKVKAIEAKFDAHDLNIAEENQSILWNEVDVCILALFHLQMRNEILFAPNNTTKRKKIKKQNE